MIYNIGNNPETAKLLQQTMPPNTKDFGWFLATVEEAISKKLQVELNFNNGNHAYGKMLSPQPDKYNRWPNWGLMWRFFCPLDPPVSEGHCLPLPAPLP